MKYGTPAYLGAASERFASRTAVAMRPGAMIFNTTLQDSSLIALQESGRWQEYTIPYGCDDNFIIVANFYGIPDSNAGGDAKDNNDTLVQMALLRAASFKRTR